MRALKPTEAQKKVLVHNDSGSSMIVPLIRDPNIVMELNILGKLGCCLSILGYLRTVNGFIRPVWTV